jgi:hypothetical protein
LIQQRQFASRAVDGEGADASTFLSPVIADFIDRIQETMIGIHRKERGIDRLRRQADG